MNHFIRALKKGFTLFAVTWAAILSADNQTPTTTPILQASLLAFSIDIETADFSLPAGLHSGVTATCKGKWILFAGRTNGLHGFENDNNNFPPSEQNSIVYVVDPENGNVFSKSLYDISSGLTQHEIDLLSVTSPQFYQKECSLYITGGYGVDTATGLFSTKDVLTVINLPKLIDWVLGLSPEHKLSDYIRQISDPIFQVTGGYMTENSDGLTLLIFGQNFEGFYTDSGNGVYLEQVERFYIKDHGNHLHVVKKDSYPIVKDPDYRRRDLNVIPIILKKKEAFIALSGVFTVDGGIWTVPVFISKNGKTTMSDPLNPSTFKQGMNNYVSANISLFSHENNFSYNVLLGGLSFGYYQSGVFLTDAEIPFINQVTTVKIDSNKNCTQYLMDAEYPVILSTGSNPGNPLLFGAGASFFQSNGLSKYRNGVIKLDKLKSKTLIGYIVGGIASTLPNTNTQSDSTASPYIFKVYLTPQ